MSKFDVYKNLFSVGQVRRVFILEILKADAAKAKEIISARPELPQQYDIVFSTGSSLPFMIRYRNCW